mmetsp:Transcript_14295/g.38881  ORF Transcript_14295/g.38881 Transcript_14295/m.38881 type:complete len:354 (-) Transcript_14295:2383-3444(-)
MSRQTLRTKFENIQSSSRPQAIGLSTARGSAYRTRAVWRSQQANASREIGLQLLFLAGQLLLLGPHFLLQCLHRVMVRLPLADDALCHRDFGFLGQRILTQVDGLRTRFHFLRAPCLAPEPVRRQGEDGHLMLREVRQVLVEIRERCWVAAELVVDVPQHITRRSSPELVKVHDEQRGDVIRFPSQMALPVALFPKPEPLDVGVRVTHRHKTVHIPFQISVPQLSDICAHHLIGVNKDDLGHVHGEENVQEKNLVRPNESLFLALRIQPGRPLVGDKINLEVVSLRHDGDEFFELGRQEVVHKPEVQRIGGVRSHREHHDAQKLLIQMPARDAENVDRGQLALDSVSFFYQVT